MRASDIKQKLRLFFCDKVFSIMFLLFVFFFFSTILSVVFPIEGVSTYEMNTNSTTTVGDVYDDQSLEFVFHSTKPKMLGMTFSAATYSRVLTEGTLFISVTNEAGKLVFAEERDGPTILDNQPISFSFAKQTDSMDQTYTVIFHTVGIDKSHAITFWANSESPAGVITSLNGAPQQTTLVYSLTYVSNSFKYTWYLLLFCTFFYVLTVVSYGRNRSENDCEPGE